MEFAIRNGSGVVKDIVAYVYDSIPGCRCVINLEIQHSTVGFTDDPGSSLQTSCRMTLLLNRLAM